MKTSKIRTLKLHEKHFPQKHERKYYKCAFYRLYTKDHVAFGMVFLQNRRIDFI